MMICFAAGMVGGIVTWSSLLAIHKRRCKAVDGADVDYMINAVKNCVMTVALVKMCKSDFDEDWNIPYEAFDGSKLPNLSGPDIFNACMSYLYSDPAEALQEPFPSLVMYQKQLAIHKYLRKHFDTEMKIVSFANEYIRTTILSDEHWKKEHIA